MDMFPLDISTLRYITVEASKYFINDKGAHIRGCIQKGAYSIFVARSANDERPINFTKPRELEGSKHRGRGVSLQALGSHPLSAKHSKQGRGEEGGRGGEGRKIR